METASAKVDEIRNLAAHQTHVLAACPKLVAAWGKEAVLAISGAFGAGIVGDMAALVPTPPNAVETPTEEPAPWGEFGPTEAWEQWAMDEGDVQ